MSNHASYGWIVTSDHLAEDGERSDAGAIGPSNIDPAIKADLLAGKGRAWKCQDGDNEVYYKGRYIGPEDESLFGPLNDFAMPNAGATDIFYRDAENRWKLV